MGKRRGVKCPKQGCNYWAEAASAKDAMLGLQEHMMEAHGEELPQELGESIAGDIKAKQKSRG